MRSLTPKWIAFSAVHKVNEDCEMLEHLFLILVGVLYNPPCLTFKTVNGGASKIFSEREMTSNKISWKANMDGTLASGCGDLKRQLMLHRSLKNSTSIVWFSEETSSTDSVF